MISYLIAGHVLLGTENGIFKKISIPRNKWLDANKIGEYKVLSSTFCALYCNSADNCNVFRFEQNTCNLAFYEVSIEQTFYILV